MLTTRSCICEKPVCAVGCKKSHNHNGDRAALHTTTTHIVVDLRSPIWGFDSAVSVMKCAVFIVFAHLHPFGWNLKGGLSHPWLEDVGIWIVDRHIRQHTHGFLLAHQWHYVVYLLPILSHSAAWKEFPCARPSHSDTMTISFLNASSNGKKWKHHFWSICI